MINLKEYIVEKFKLGKDFEDTGEIDNIITGIDNFIYGKLRWPHYDENNKDEEDSFNISVDSDNDNYNIYITWHNIKLLTLVTFDRIFNRIDDEVDEVANIDKDRKHFTYTFDDTKNVMEFHIKK